MHSGDMKFGGFSLLLYSPLFQHVVSPSAFYAPRVNVASEFASLAFPGKTAYAYTFPSMFPAGF
jgi:hypothetical protein